jgi:hypothetical protein
MFHRVGQRIRLNVAVSKAEDRLEVVEMCPRAYHKDYRKSPDQEQGSIRTGDVVLDLLLLLYHQTQIRSRTMARRLRYRQGVSFFVTL